jgi:rfaE bifunctional protein kinase chain/domain
MKTFQSMSAERLREIVDGFTHTRISVLGDFFLDKYLDVDPALAEVSVETGKTAHQVVDVRHSPGAAGTVVSNLAALGAGIVHAVGFTGEDGEAYELRRDLEQLGCTTKHLHCDGKRKTPTYLKPRDASDPSLAGEHSRYDTKNRVRTSQQLEQRIVESLDSLLPEVDAVIVLDQVEESDCGVVTAAMARAVAERVARWPDVIFWADSRRRIHQFRNVMIKPNQFEAVGHENPNPDDQVSLQRLAKAIEPLRARTRAPIFVTRGVEGILVSDPELTLVPGVNVSGPTDPTGAGDSVTAGAVLALASGATCPEAALVGNLVASITVQQLATTGTAEPAELPRRLDLWLKQRRCGRNPR